MRRPSALDVGQKNKIESNQKLAPSSALRSCHLSFPSFAAPLRLFTSMQSLVGLPG
jgi:hypothetical protein